MKNRNKNKKKETIGVITKEEIIKQKQDQLIYLCLKVVSGWQKKIDLERNSRKQTILNNWKWHIEWGVLWFLKNLKSVD